MKSKPHLSLENSFDLSVVLSSSDAIMICNANGEIEWVNDSFTRITLYPINEVKGKLIVERLTGSFTDKESIERMEKAIQAQTPLNEEMLFYKKNGDPIWFSISMTPVVAEERRLVNFVVVMRDITERKELERQVARLQAQLAGLKIFEGWITKCAWDKTVKDKNGNFIDIEKYIERYSDARFTHGISPEARDRIRKRKSS